MIFIISGWDYYGVVMSEALSELEDFPIGEPFHPGEHIEVQRTEDGRLYVAANDIRLALGLNIPEYISLADDCIRVEPNRHSLLVDGKHIRVSRMGFDLAHLLAINVDTMLEFSEIAQVNWGYADKFVIMSVRAQMSKLRKAIGEPHSDSNTGVFRTIRSGGYMAVSTYAAG